MANLDAEKRELLDSVGGDHTIWDRLNDVLSSENEDKAIAEIIGSTYTEVEGFFMKHVYVGLCVKHIWKHIHRRL